MPGERAGGDRWRRWRRFGLPLLLLALGARLRGTSTIPPAPFPVARSPHTGALGGVVLRYPGPVSLPSFSPDGWLLYARASWLPPRRFGPAWTLGEAEYRTLCAYDLDAGRVRWRATLDGWVEEYQITPDGREVVCFSATPGSARQTDGPTPDWLSTVTYFDARTGRLIRRLPLGVDGCDWSLSPDGELLAGRADWADPSPSLGTIEVRIWNARNGQLVHTVLDAIGPTAFSPDGRFFATCGAWDGENITVMLFDARTWRLLRRLQAGDGLWAKGLAVSSRTPLVASIEDRVHEGSRLTVWDGRSGRILRRVFAADADLSVPIRLSDDEATLSYGGGSLDLRRPRADRRPLLALGGGGFLGDYSQDGRLVLFVDDNDPALLELWDAPRCRRVCCWRDPAFDCSYGEERAFHPGRHALATVRLPDRIWVGVLDAGRRTSGAARTWE